ncbi:FAD binding domain-containing protein [Evansella tamaricis]|uniref:FAD binding domain-containing protein n=1 Tax=Evansella tamaricis TaxID=2069301 RepID=A0ABS6JNN8_9BACI|nr:FAD binding domain-containing protein [Evansella tamaricis]MBU9713918.1 FAD binding domain-containing protein [Evansella tamaricis]
MTRIQQVWFPKTLEEAYKRYLSCEENGSYVSGGTWLRTIWEADHKTIPPHLISLENITEMSAITIEEEKGDEVLVIGSLVTLNQCLKNTLIQKYFPSLITACKQIAAPSIRNQGTLGGNIRTTFGDTLPVFLVLRGQLTWFNGTSIERESVQNWLANPVPSDGRILVNIILPIKKHSGEGNKYFSFYKKVGRREIFIPSLVTVAGSAIKGRDGTLEEVVLAAGGGVMVPKRLSNVEELLQGTNALTKEQLSLIYETCLMEYEPQADVFATAFYKKKVAANLIFSEWFQMMKGENDQIEGGTLYATES